MRVVLGIGNPGREYAATRHNAGFMVVDALAARLGATGWTKQWQAQVAECRLGDDLGGGRLMLVKPTTYVNVSGESAQAVLAFHKLPPQALLVVVDDINLPLGTLRLRASGSAGGHNGLKDIEARLGQEYPRLRLGVGSPRSGADQIAHVLGSFAPEERADAEAMIAKAADCCLAWLREGVVVACAFNGPLRPPVKPAPLAKPDPPAKPPGHAESGPA